VHAEKENLVLVNSFYTNSILLRELIDFLNDHVNVHFIDLPGFALHAPPLNKVNLDSYARYVGEKIKSLELDHYILSGISFGYTVVCRLPRDERCKGVVAIFPFLGRKSLKLNWKKRLFYILAVNIFTTFRLSAWAWKTRLLRKFAFWYSTYPPDRVRIILDHMDGRTFFETGRIIFHNRIKLPFQDLPHVLILNPEDTTIRYDYALRLFTENVKELCLLHIDMDHYPVNPSEEYFRERFQAENIKCISDFFKTDGRPNPSLDSRRPAQVVAPRRPQPDREAARNSSP
jgi:pimeloyl-ACP methyl ester carboxylesterase